MLQKRNLTIRVKTGPSWVMVEDVSITFWVAYKQLNLTWYKEEVSYIEIRQLNVPSWAECYKKTIKEYLESNPQKLHDSKRGDVLNVE